MKPKNIKPEDIVLSVRAKLIKNEAWSVTAQRIAWAIVKACQVRKGWEALSLQEIQAHNTMRGKLLVDMVDSFFQPQELLEFVACRYVPTEKFIMACFDAQQVGQVEK